MTSPQKHRRVAALAVFAVAALTVVPAEAAPAFPDKPSETKTVRTNGGYDVFVGGLHRATVPVSDLAYTVRVSASADGSQAAAIADFNGTSGSRLLVIDKAGKSREVATGEITSAVFSGSGELAYLSKGEVRVSGEPLKANSGKSLGTIGGRAPELLGWTSDGTGLLAVQHPDVQHDGTYVSTLSRFDVASGATRELLAGNKETLYRDMKLVDIGGERHVSFIQGNDVYRCGSDRSKNTLGLVTESGKVTSLVAESGDNYRSAAWSEDGRKIAYEVMACVEKSDAGLARLDQVNGVYVHDLGTKGTQRVVRGLSHDYRLQGFSGEAVRIGSPLSGTRNVLAQDGVDAQSLDSRPGEVTTQARLNRAEYIHQLWDTRDDFNGNSSCGPTSAVIDLVTYQLPGQFGVQVSQPSSHWSKWGRYITDQYAKNGTTFNRTMGDYNQQGAWKGAHGWITGMYCGGTHPCAAWENERDYLARNGAAVTQHLGDPNWVRARINEGKFVITSGVWGATQGHLSVIIGYTDDGRFYVHDTYGKGTDGSYDGANVIYTWDYIRPAQMWAA